jgi:hypothetical protein
LVLHPQRRDGREAAIAQAQAQDEQAATGFVAEFHGMAFGGLMELCREESRLVPTDNLDVGPLTKAICRAICWNRPKTAVNSSTALMQNWPAGCQ